MTTTRSALRLTVLVGESHTWHHRPLYSEVVHRAHRAGLAGASVFRGIEGFGASSVIHTSRLLSLSEDLPVAVVIVDAEDRIRAFLPELEELVTEGLVVVDPCEIVFRGAPRRTADDGPEGGRGEEGGHTR
ncbi:DUF190 domain-containing protein [Streptomyces sp. NPDC053560]|uniref:DUF190 domain-containing protein n=1 Tax=Streptomyces sp. NPDC053560 TaxID=3365711 RepID=UPI0037D20CDF